MAKPLSHRQFAMLATVYLRPRPAHELHDRGTLEVTMLSLERRGLVSRRGRSYQITDSGRAEMTRAADVARGTDATATTTGAP